MLENKNDIELKAKARCSKCGSTQVYLRVRSMQKFCRQCGNLDPIEIKQKDESDE